MKGLVLNLELAHNRLISNPLADQAAADLAIHRPEHRIKVHCHRIDLEIDLLSEITSHA
jgi:hypothetical protein